jgi:hypothetical protein
VVVAVRHRHRQDDGLGPGPLRLGVIVEVVVGE